MNAFKTVFGDTDISIKRADFFGLLFNQFVKINYSDIKNVTVVDSIQPNGKPVIRGTGDFWNYFPSGLKKNPKEKIFIIEQKNKRWKIGFSSDEWTGFISILKKNGISITTNLC